MPSIRVEMFEGRTDDQKRNLVKQITEAVSNALEVDPQIVQIQIQETQRSHYARGGILASEHDRS